MFPGKPLPFKVLCGEKKGRRKYGVRYLLYVRTMFENTCEDLIDLPIYVDQHYEMEMDAFLKEINKKAMEAAERSLNNSN